MGLFDIFRRKKKSEKATVNESAATSDSSVASQSVSQAVDSASSQSTSTPVESSASAVVSSAVEEAESSATVSESTAVSSVSEVSESTTASEEPTTPGSATTAVGSETPVAASSATPLESQAESQSSVSKASETVESESPASPASENAESEASAASEEERYDKGLEKSRTGFGARLNRFLANFRHVDEDFFDDLEDLMIESDVGYDMAMKLSDSLQEEVKLQNAKSKQEVSNVIIEKMVSLYEEAGNGENNQINYAKNGPTVIMFVGVNGAGKTTTIGKLAARYKRQGKKVLLAAADTFRAGAVEQLDVWAKRDGVDIVTGPENGDPAAVVFDGVKKAKEENYDLLLVDTAGRLQNKVNLMNELAKMKRVLSREIPDAPHEVLLVLDATTGQNALNQAKLFKESTDVTGIVLTKLDGTARGGIVLAIRNELHLPVKLVGLGEHVDDLADFDASEFVYGLFKGLVNE